MPELEGELTAPKRFGAEQMMPLILSICTHTYLLLYACQPSVCYYMSNMFKFFFAALRIIC